MHKAALLATRASSQADPITNPGTGTPEITIDIVVGTDAMTMPGYQIAGAFDSHTGSLGPLPVGVYQLIPTVRVIDSQTNALVPMCPGFSISMTFPVQPSPAPTAAAPVIEYYDAVLDHYFLTQDAHEIQAIDGGAFPGWLRTGQSFLAYLPGQSDSRGDRISRYYGLPGAGLDSHFYTSFPWEIRSLLPRTWPLEAEDVFEIPTPSSLTGDCPAGTIPVYRLWNHRSDNDHRFTIDLAIRQAMLAAGYVSEGFGPNGVAMCAIAQ